jgi:hypothetical protein
VERRATGHRAHGENLHLGSLVAEIDPGFIPVDLSLLSPTVALRHERATYPDIREAYQAGRINNLREHFIEDGYLEGRLGTDPRVDDRFYRETYPDVAKAVGSGKVKSAFDHYVTAGCFEGRCANEADMERMTAWLEVLKPP